MKSVAYRSRSSWLRITASPFFALAVLLVIFGGIWASGVVDSCWFGINCPRSIEGLVAVPVSVQHIPAYTSIRREHVWNMKTGEMSKVLLPPEQISETMKVNLKDVLGRVLARDKPPGYVFTEADFLPPGSRQGLVGGIPPGKRAVRVEADQVRGLYGLNPGDRFDLIATLPIDADSKGNALNLGGSIWPAVGLASRSLELVQAGDRAGVGSERRPDSTFDDPECADHGEYADQGNGGQNQARSGNRHCRGS
jgi:hypothetical protein